MKKGNTWFFVTLGLWLVCLILLVTGSPLLTQPLPGNDAFPWGTIITWIGMFCLPLSIYWGVEPLRSPQRKPYHLLAYALKILIILGLFWAPLSYLLAGNWSFSFSEKETFQGGQSAIQWFWRMSYGIGIGSVAILFTHWMLRLFRKG